MKVASPTGGQALASLLEQIEQRLPTTWTQWPGGYPAQVELALVDAVLSIRSRYGTPTTGVRKRVGLYRQHRAVEAPDDLSVLAAFEPEHLADVLQSRQRTGGSLKASAIVGAAGALVAVGVRTSAHVDADSTEQKAAYVGVDGLGPVTWQYLLMLIGKPGVKADRWICRFVGDALGRPVGSAEAFALVHEAAASRKVSPTDLDHAIWSYMSRRRSA